MQSDENSSVILHVLQEALEHMLMILSYFG